MDKLAIMRALKLLACLALAIHLTAGQRTAVLSVARTIGGECHSPRCDGPPLSVKAKHADVK